MGPLVPDFISDQLNLVVALLLGIAFGFVLEQAGFSSSRKLTGLFYGRDFTVLRVFFTAGVTAMSGVLLLTQFGWLDPDLIYVNPTFLHSAILGGVIMGLGFVVGGYCPGTSVCAAAVGKIDAMAFVGGSLLGIFGFAEAFPHLEGFYKAGSLGDLAVYTPFGLTSGQFAGILIAVALGVFVLTTRIEKKVNPDSPAKAFPVAWHRVAAAGVLILGLVLMNVPDRKVRLAAKASDAGFIQQHPVSRMTADELAIHILDSDPHFQLIDVRDAANFAKMSLPGAINIPAGDMFGKQWRGVIDPRSKKVFFARDDAGSVSAAALAGLLGYENVAVLQGGLDGFTRTILNSASIDPQGTAADLDARQFRRRAAPQIAALMRERGAQKPPKALKRIQGGCGS